MAGGREHRWDPATYLDFVTAEIPAYERLQDELVAATRGDAAPRTILELGCGTGETTGRVLAEHPAATVTGIDESPEMLAAAQDALVNEAADLRLARLEDPLLDGPFDLVFSALAVHHLDGPGKADLFARVAAVLAPGGRFVLADLVVPEGPPVDGATPVDGDYDTPDTVAAQLGWLRDAGFDAGVAWAEGDLAVISAER